MSAPLRCLSPLSSKSMTVFTLVFAVLGLRWCTGLPQMQRVAGASSCCSAWASHCRGLSFCGTRLPWLAGSAVAASWLRSCGSQVLESWLSSCATGSAARGMGDLPDQGSNPCFLLWQVDFLALSRQGSPLLLSWYCLLKIACRANPSFPSRLLQMSPVPWGPSLTIVLKTAAWLLTPAFWSLSLS